MSIVFVKIRRFVPLLVIGAAAGLLATPLVTAHSPVDPPTAAADQEAAYAVGYEIAQRAMQKLADDDLALEPAAIARGFSDAVLDRQPALSPDEIEQRLVAIERDVSTRRAEARLREDPVFRILAEDNDRRGATFRERFAQRPDVTELATGVLVEWIERGPGVAAGPEVESLTMTFTGTTASGVRFTDKVNETVSVRSTFPAVAEALHQARVGDRAILVVPPEHAYGLAGHEGGVGPNETVVFSLEVLGITQ